MANAGAPSARRTAISRREAVTRRFKIEKMPNPQTALATSASSRLRRAIASGSQRWRRSEPATVP
jgi:hypothetical protein